MTDQDKKERDFIIKTTLKIVKIYLGMIIVLVILKYLL